MSDAVVDNGQMMAMLKALSGDQLFRITRDALKETGDIFAAQTQLNVDASPLSGKKATRVKVDQFQGTVSVDIFGTPLARIFEGGSYKAAASGGRKVSNYKGKELVTPANRGNIRAYRFLGSAFDQHGQELAENFERIFANLIKTS